MVNRIVCKHVSLKYPTGRTGSGPICFALEKCDLICFKDLNSRTEHQSVKGKIPSMLFCFSTIYIVYHLNSASPLSMSMNKECLSLENECHYQSLMTGDASHSVITA